MGRTKSVPKRWEELPSYRSDPAQYPTFDDRAQPHALQDEHYSFLSTLAAAQVFGVDVTPLTWQPHLASLGEGGTATISESLVHAQLSLAFKRCDRKFSSHGRLYENLVRELCILSQEPVKSHPNIIHLQCICFETQDEGDTALPVLVFNKAEYGDLHKFMSTALGQEMSVSSRIEILRQIVDAVATLHKMSELQN